MVSVSKPLTWYKTLKPEIPTHPGICMLLRTSIYVVGCAEHPRSKYGYKRHTKGEYLHVLISLRWCLVLRVYSRLAKSALTCSSFPNFDPLTCAIVDYGQFSDSQRTNSHQDPLTRRKTSYLYIPSSSALICHYSIRNGNISIKMAAE